MPRSPLAHRGPLSIEDRCNSSWFAPLAGASIGFHIEVDLPCEDVRSKAEAGLRRMEHQASATTDEKYSTAVLQAGSFLRAGLAPFAAARAVDATLLAPKRWEAYAIAGAAFRRLDKLDRAKEMLQLAVQRATPSAKPRLQKELAEIATDQTCAPYIKRAAEAANRHHFNAAAKELATAWETACGTRDEVGLAAAGALLRSGDRTTAERILTALSKSRDSRTLREVDALRAR